MHGAARLKYPQRHIEADNRLSWYLGRLAERYDGTAVKYVHLLRDPEAVANSHFARWDSPFRASSIRAFGHGIIMGVNDWSEEERLEISRDYVATVTANIKEFLRGRDAMTVQLETAKADFPAFLDWIGAKGDLDAAVSEWEVRHNESSSDDVAPSPSG